MKRIDIETDKNSNFIGCWNINDDKLCNEIIELFENNKKDHGQGQTGKGLDEKIKKSTDLTIDPLSLNDPKYNSLKVYFNKLNDCFEDYKEQWPVLKKIFQKAHIESFNIQKYLQGDHFSQSHCERHSTGTLHRYLAWMTYLNNVEKGGDTRFDYFGVSVKPEIGKTLIWPADWTHLHAGEVLKSGSKYIITGWMHIG